MNELGSDICKSSVFTSTGTVKGVFKSVHCGMYSKKSTKEKMSK